MNKHYIAPLIAVMLSMTPIPIDYAQTIASAPTMPSAQAAASTAVETVKPALTAVQKIEVRVTAYASVPQETDNTPFITASGKHVADGFIAANFLPFGTKVQIPSLFGDKIFTVEDRMNRRMVGFVDIWMPSVAQAIDFGTHKTDIVVLGNPGPTVAMN